MSAGLLIRHILALALLLATAVAHGTGASVKLRELRSEDEQRLRKDLPALFSGDATPAILDEALRQLMALGTYENIFVERTGTAQYEIIGKPLRLVEDIRFNGVRAFDLATLREVLEIKAGERFDRKRAVSSGEKLKIYYGENGFFNAVLDVELIKADNGNITVVYSVKENPPCRIVGLVFETPNRDLRAKLNSRFKRLLNKPLTTERVRRLMADMNEYLILNRYLAAEVTGPEPKYNAPKTEAALVFEVREPLRFEFYFYGHPSETLAGMYAALDLKNRERKNLDPAAEGAERLRRHYMAKGFANVSVETEIEVPEESYLRKVHYVIKEGPRVRIKNIEVAGRISRASKYYQNFILANSSDLVSKGYYNRQDLENGFKNLQTELRNQGFLRARVLSSRVEYVANRSEAVIYLMLEEGPQTQIRAVDFEGNRFFSSFELAQVTGMQTNSPLRLTEFEASLEKIKAFYRNQGFLEMRLLNENDEIIQYNEKGTQARISYRIFEGPRIRVNAIAVEGNTFTKTRVILKEADFQLGEVLTPQKLEDATARLNKMGLFQRAAIRTLEEGTNVAERTLVISVTERDPGVLRFGAGVNNERNLTVRGFTGLSYNNLFGTGRGISGRVELTSNVAEINFLEHEVTAGYLEPFLFDTRTRGRVNLTRSERVFEYIREGEMVALTASNRVDFLAERDLTQRTRLTWKLWSLESRQERERDGRCLRKVNEAFDPNSSCSPITRQIATLGPTVDIDYRDNPFLPTRGSFSRLIVDYSAPQLASSSGIEFIRTEGNFTYYSRLGSPDLVWANSVRGGYVSNLSPDRNSGVPTSHAFLLGGIYTLRGFDITTDTERLPRQGSGATPANPGGFQVLPGNPLIIKDDSHYYLVKSELRFPVYENHGGVIFYDGAAVLVTGYDFGRPYRDAVGFGYRYNTPVGPVALDIAFKIAPEKGEDPFRVHLSIGTF